jgi:DNA-binding beta-propeller fold protein YncE
MNTHLAIILGTTTATCVSAGTRIAIARQASLLLFIWGFMMHATAMAGNLYVGVGPPSTASGVIYQYTPEGTQTTFASGINGVFGLAFDGSGNLYESGPDQINKFSSAGVESMFAPLGGEPLGLAFDPNGNLFAACENDVIYKITPAGSVSAFATLSLGGYSIYDLAFNSSGDLFVSNYGLGGDSGSVLVFAQWSAVAFHKRLARRHWLGL